MTETIASDQKKETRALHLRRYGYIFISGLLMGFILLTAVRFVLAKDTSVHYHANFALYINGQKDDFKSFTFYEEVASCNAEDHSNPKNHVHMHDQKNHLAHVHSEGMTWGQFFANLGYTLGDDLIATDDGTFITGDDGNKLTFTLNGQDTDAVANKVIGNEDALLINYGKDNQQTISQRYEAIPRDARQANMTKDPAACSGGNEFTFWNRLKQALGFPATSH